MLCRLLSVLKPHSRPSVIRNSHADVACKDSKYMISFCALEHPADLRLKNGLYLDADIKDVDALENQFVVACASACSVLRLANRSR